MFSAIFIRPSSEQITNCSCDSNVTYIGMTKRQLSMREKDHLHLKKDSAVQIYINVCQSRKGNKHLFDNFSILKTCNTQYSKKFQEALLIKTLSKT